MVNLRTNMVFMLYGKVRFLNL